MASAPYFNAAGAPKLAILPRAGIPSGAGAPNPVSSAAGARNLAIRTRTIVGSNRAGGKTRHAARAMLFDRLYGKAKEKIEHTGEGGKDLMPTVNIIIEPPTSSQTGTGTPQPGD